MIDFHSHILPFIDDGASTIDESIEMLRLSKKAGVDTVVCTSHCYPKTQEDIDNFIIKRDTALEQLQAEIDKLGENLPRLVPACELNLKNDVSEFDNLERLCIAGTKYIMVEMPLFDKWPEWVYESIFNLTIKGLRPIIVHLDRYPHQLKEIPNLYELDVLFQINTDSFLNFFVRRRSIKFVNEGHGHIIGSDMHNTKGRKTTYSKAVEMICKKLGKEYIDYFDKNGRAILNNEHVSRHGYKKLGTNKH